MNWGYERDGRATKEKAKKAHGWSRVRKCAPSAKRRPEKMMAIAREGLPEEIPNARIEANGSSAQTFPSAPIPLSSTIKARKGAGLEASQKTSRTNDIRRPNEYTNR